IIDEAVVDFSAWARSLALAPAIEQLREWAESVRAAEVAKLAKKENIDLEQLDRTTKALVNKLLHRPMTKIRDLVREQDGKVYLEAFQELFDLDPE
ncbi:MAG: glutamyl-tRNA reductase, partial [Actinomycetota bacterium]